MTTNGDLSPIAPLGREEYIEQAHFFAVLVERLRDNVPAQEVLQTVREEVLATSKLPMAIDFLLSELRHEGVFGPAMTQILHYFTPFQAFVVNQAEDERSRFDLRIGLDILGREAKYRAGNYQGKEPSIQGLFLFQFETLCRNRLGYDRGLEAVAGDPAYDETWRDWILGIRHQVGIVDIADLIYVHSKHYQERSNRSEEDEDAGRVVLFGSQEGRIALANRRKDPLYLFNSMHRQLGYPEIPRPETADEEEALLPQLARRMELLEKRITLVEDEQRGGIDITKFYGPPDDST